MIPVVTSLDQVAVGLRIAGGESTTCDACGAPLHAGQRIVLALRQASDGGPWSLDGRFCDRCGQSRTLGARGSALVAGRVGITSDAATQSSWASLVDSDPISALLRRPGIPRDPHGD
jgi:hypothetical protein